MIPTSRLTLQSAFRQIALRLNARSPLRRQNRSDDSDLGTISKITEALVRRLDIPLAAEVFDLCQRCYDRPHEGE